MRQITALQHVACCQIQPNNDYKSKVACGGQYDLIHGFDDDNDGSNAKNQLNNDKSTNIYL